MYHDKQKSYSSQVLISYFHLSRKLKTLNHVSRNNPFTPLYTYSADAVHPIHLAFSVSVPVIAHKESYCHGLVQDTLAKKKNINMSVFTCS